MKYISFAIVVLCIIVGFSICSLIHIGNGSAAFIGGFLGIMVSCLFFNWRKRKSETLSSSLLSNELLRSREALKAEAQSYVRGKFRW